MSFWLVVFLFLLKECFIVCIYVAMQYIHRKTAKAAGETNVQEKIKVIVRCLQQTAIVTYGSQQKVIHLESNFVALSTKMQQLRTKMKAINYRGIDMPSSSTLQSSSMGSKEIESIESTVHTARKVPDNDLEVAQVVVSAKENGLTMITPNTAVRREHTSHTPPTLESILGHSSTSTKLPSLDSPHFSSTDMEFVDIKSLKERVDIMQSRLTHTIEHAKSARKKTLSIFSSRRSMVSSVCVCARAITSQIEKVRVRETERGKDRETGTYTYRHGHAERWLIFTNSAAYFTSQKMALNSASMMHRELNRYRRPGPWNKRAAAIWKR